MKKVEFPRWLLSSLLLLLLVLPSAAAGNDTIAEVENLGDTLVFHPVVQFHEMILTVTGPCGFEYRQVVNEGELVFRLDATTIDGAYRYNLFRTEAVDPGIVKILQQARLAQNDEVSKQLCRDGKLPGPPQVQAAGFQVSRGEIIYDPGAVEKALGGDGDVSMDELLAMKPDRGAGAAAPPTKDFVINDDLIVDGSACIGFDCVNGEVFSFDTIRLKENNLRIKFDDTSTAASFPRNDWQLTANESANGGASKFSIEDITGGRTPFTVEANARSHSLYVDDGGRIGSRTSTPSVEIHTIDGDTPTLRLQQDGSSGFEPQTWDVAGNETNFFIRDVTNGSALPFRIRPGAPSNAILVDVDGDVGLGTSSPSNSLHVRRTNATAKVLVEDTNISAVDLMRLKSPGAATRMEFENTTAGVTWKTGVTNSGNYVWDTAAAAGVEMFLLTNGNMTITGDYFSSTCPSPTPCAPDYVFEPDYPLMPLSELQAFVAAEKHLPNVPSAEELTGPINISKLQMKLLEKIEELTLYVLDQHETIQSQQEVIRTFQERLTQLENQ